MDAACFGLAGATLGASQCRFARHTQYLEYIIPILHGRGSTWSTYIEVSGRLRTSWDTWAPPVFAWQPLHLEHLYFAFRRKGSIWSISVPSGVARAALGANHLHFVWRGEDMEHLHGGPRKAATSWVTWAPPAFAWQALDLEHLTVILRGVNHLHPPMNGVGSYKCCDHFL